MDEKGIKKIIQIITTIIELREKNKLKLQGYNDRMGVAREIYQRNKHDVEFVNTLNSAIESNMEELYELIIKE